MPWLLKTEPETYSWEDLVRDGKTLWDGVRNYQARNNLRAMRRGERALIYHSGPQKAAVGIAEVIREHYPDPTTDDDRWSVVDIRPVAALARPVTLAEVKGIPELADIPLVRVSRLSVQPLDEAAFERIVALGGGQRALKKPAAKKPAAKSPRGAGKTGASKAAKRSPRAR